MIYLPTPKRGIRFVHREFGAVWPVTARPRKCAAHCAM